MRCPKCHREVPDKAKRCPHCNAGLDPTAATAAASVAPVGASILVVDDDKILLSVLNRILSGAGFAVTTAGDVATAVAAFHDHRFDVVLTDLVMPGGSGLEVIANARRVAPNA